MAFEYRRMVYLGDTDAAGVIYFAQGLSLCHEAYEAWVVSLGLELNAFFRETAVAIPIVRAEIDFWRPLVAGDGLVISLIPELLSETEFEISYQIHKTNGDKPCAQAKTRHVCIDRQTRRRAPLPEVLRNPMAEASL